MHGVERFPSLRKTGKDGAVKLFLEAGFNEEYRTEEFILLKKQL